MRLVPHILPALAALATVALAVSAPPAVAVSPDYQRPWIEFADLEHTGGCPPLIQAATGPQALSSWTQEQLDQLYACSKAGPMPSGFMNGGVVIPGTTAPSSPFGKFLARLGFSFDHELQDLIAIFWQGKVFYPQDHALLNKIGPNVKKVLGRDLRGQLRFPAKVYCGQSLLDSRHESLIIDYAFSDRVKIAGQSPYNDDIDWLAAGRMQSGKRGLNIRDEIRMVRPGFYLGRAYMDRVFALSFTLTTATPVTADDTCWPGYPPVN